MGGGGGSGHENDGVGTVGAAGGGIVMIKAATFSTNSTCSGVSISANGNSAASAQNDGAGGGGAGGTVLFNVGTFNVASACALTVAANGGNGGNSNASSTGAHGGGGGGGQGAVIYSAAQPVTNVVSTTTNGSGGVSCSGCGSGVNGSSSSGTTNSGIITNASGPLPVELLSFTAYPDASENVILEWVTMVEKNSDRFVIQRMVEGESPVTIGEMPTKGSNSHYTFTDSEPVKGVLYYRLKQIDKDGVASFKPWVEVNLKKETLEEITLYPNPFHKGEELFIHYTEQNSSDLQFELCNMASQTLVNTRLSSSAAPIFKCLVPELPAGIYTAKISVNGKSYYKKLLVQN
jgi:hypothetical protein